ncbi:phage C domain-containing [Fusarium albosuccineum]|uniref:Phage C domain-containing n=1 Tax=Fusarium albosuccineum TaxID=1237068 RepID=A0A8H4PIP5_9HYPO|nr:phage C domain-containing [Fusarium albosuccineum]
MSSNKRQSRTASRENNISKSSDTQSGSIFAREVQIECDRLAEQIARVPAIVRERLSGAEEVQVDGRSRRSTNPDLIAQLHKADREIQRREATIQHLTNELDSYQRETQNLRAKEQSLRNFMHESDFYPEVSEHKVVAAFAGVRQKVQKLVSSKMYRMEGRELRTESNLLTIGKDLHGLWQKATQPNRRLILRAIVYKRLADEILDYEFFGAAEPNVEDSIGSKINSIIAGLSQFERIQVGNKVSNDIVSNWRLLTLKSVETIGLTKGPFGTALAEQMHDYFTAFIVEEATQEDREKLLEAFTELCNEAYALRLLMRKSKNNYRCVSIGTGVPEENTERYADVFGELEDAPNGSKKVALTLFGCLTAHTQNSTDNYRVLEKAQIIVAKN